MTTGTQQHSAFKGINAVASAVAMNSILANSGGRAKIHAHGDSGDETDAANPEPVDPANDGQPANLEPSAGDATSQTDGEVQQADKDADEVEGVS
ncbi:MAG: hypothetical protein KBD55_02750 [Candidatus Pacebacteria bacterium]|jgi:hypothetical protein|nr:hypothetical protein [Candidatus Paceibacterota bacterium]